MSNNPGPSNSITSNTLPVVADTVTGTLSAGKGVALTIPGANLPPNTMNQGQRSHAPTVALLGDSTMAYFWEPITVSAASSVTGNGILTTVNSNFQPVLDGTVLNCDCLGAPFDQQQVVASSINNTTFTFPSPLVGSPPTILVCSNSMLYSDRSFIVWANRQMGQKLNVIQNACFGGNTPAQMLARIPTQVLPYAPSYCIVLGGINFPPNTTAQSIFGFMVQIYQLLQANNIIPIALTILPLASGYPNYSTVAPVIVQANQLIKNYCAANNIICIDTFAAVVDNTASTGAGVSGYYPATDNVHFNTQGARLIGAAIATALNPLFPAAPLYGTNAVDTYGSNSGNYNLMDQSPYASSGGTLNNSGGGTAPTGTLPTGFVVNHVNNTTGTCVASVVARTVGTDGDTVGNNVQLVMTAGSGSADQWTLIVGGNSGSVDLTSRLVAGGTYQFRCTLRLSGTSGSKLYQIGNYWLINDAGSVRTGYTGGGFTDAGITQNDSQWADGTYSYASAPFTCPAWASSGCAVQFYFNFQAAVGTAVTVNIGRCTLARLS